MRLMEGEHVGPFNLGNPGEFTMLELAQVIVLILWRNSLFSNIAAYSVHAFFLMARFVWNNLEIASCLIVYITNFLGTDCLFILFHYKQLSKK